MGEAAALMGIAAAGEAVGGALNAKAGSAKAIPVKPPAPLFPGVTQGYMDHLLASGIIPQSFGTLKEAAATGLPTDVGPAFDAMKASMGRLTDEGRANVIEKFGVQGLRFGTDLDRAAVDFESQNARDFASILAKYTMDASEGAANRRVAAAAAGQGAAADLATTFAPTEIVVGGQSSALGTGLQAGGRALSNFLLMRELFPNAGQQQQQQPQQDTSRNQTNG